MIVVFAINELMANLFLFNYRIDFNQLWHYAIHCAMAKYAKQLKILQFCHPNRYLYKLAIFMKLLDLN